jgi:hypothetical protein
MDCDIAYILMISVLSILMKIQSCGIHVGSCGRMKIPYNENALQYDREVQDV